MSLKERTINVDIMTKEYTKLKYKQGEAEQNINVKLFKNGEQIDLIGLTISAFFEKPNGEILEKAATFSNDAAVITLSKQILNAAGEVKVELFIAKGEELVISFTIMIDVEESIDVSSAAEEKEEWDSIKDLLIKSNNISMIDDNNVSNKTTSSSYKINSQLEKIKNDFDSQIKEKANKNEVGSPLVASTVSEMTNTEKIYVYTGNEVGYINGNWYSYNGTSWISGGVYNSQGIGIKEVEPINTTFIEEIKSKNILDQTIIKTGTIFGSTGSTVQTDEDPNFMYFKLEVKENTDYTVTGTSYHYYILDENDVILKKGGNSNSSIPNVTITTPINAKYIGVNFKPKIYPPETFMVVEGTEMPSEYVPFFNYLKFTKDIYEEEEISYEKVYVSATGNDSNDGLSSSNPLKTFQKAVDLGATTIIGIRGTYKGQTINADNKTNLKIVVNNITSSGDETSKIIIDNSENIDFTLDSSTGLYQSNITFSSESNWYKVFIDKSLTPIRSGLRSESYNCILWEINTNDFTKDKKLIPVLSLDECLSTPGSFYYNGTTINLNPTDNTIDNKLYKRLIIEEGNILSFSNIQYLTLGDIEVLFPPESALYINKSSNVEVTASNFGYSAYTTNVVTDKSNVQFNYCKSYKATGDGFAPISSGNHEFINCYGFYNYDDGLSHHDGCTGRVQGGEYYNNVKGGVAPAHGAVVSMENIISHNNGYGFYCQADRNIGRNQNLMNCVAYENNYGISVKNYHIKTFNCKFDNNTNPTKVIVNENTSLTEL